MWSIGFIPCKKYTSVMYANDKDSDSDPCKLVIWVVSVCQFVTAFEKNCRNFTPQSKLQTDAHATTERSIRQLFLQRKAM